MTLASLPMYDRPEVQDANDRFWQAIRTRLGHGPQALARGGDPWAQWEDPELLLSQTCGYPYRARLHGKVTLVGTPDYGLQDCPPGHYNSVIVARADDSRDTPVEFAQARFAFNEPLSQSGWAAPQNFARAHGFAFGDPQQTGGHYFSARAVAEGRADVAGLDALSWVMMQRYDDFTAALKVIARTPPTPALPYITAKKHAPGPVSDAIAAAITDLSEGDRATLSLRGIVAIPARDYLAVPNPPPPQEV